MKEEVTYGIYDWNGRHDGDVTDESVFATTGIQEGQSLIEETARSDFLSADRRLLQYHLYFSSKL
jgi:hypothetical protein